MKFNINRDDLLPALQIISNVVDRRQTLPILSNLLFNLGPNSISITATDMEIELIINIDLNLGQTGELTLPARKLLDICKALPPGSTLQFEIKSDRVSIRSEKSRFILATLSPQEYPVINIDSVTTRFSIEQSKLEQILESTQFAMAQQDVRYYLNGLLFEISGNTLRAVATDGHRLALDEVDIQSDLQDVIQIIVPKKGIMELKRLLHGSDGNVDIQVTANHIRIKQDDFIFTSKLVDGKFPEYQRVIPKKTNKLIVASRKDLYHSLIRASILSNEKYRGIRMIISQGRLQALAHNPEQEEAEEELEVSYDGEKIEIGFNVSYLLDVLSIIGSDRVELSILDSNSSCLILPEAKSRCQYVVMPMRL